MSERSRGSHKTRNTSGMKEINKAKKSGRVRTTPGRQKKSTLPVVAVVFAGIVAIAAIAGRLNADQTSEVTAAGLNYLQGLESAGTVEVEQILQEQRAARLKAESDERRQQLLDGTIDVWSLFGDSVILGDSRAVGFWSYEFLPEARVLSASGDTIEKISEHLDELEKLNPQTVFLCYGLNDVSIGIWPTKEAYVNDYRDILKTLQSRLPNTQIYVNSILPAQEVAIQLESSWENIPDYSNAVREMCEEEGYGWVNCDDLVQEYVDLYDVDGIHMRREFYPYWAAQMMIAVYDNALASQLEDNSIAYDQTSGEGDNSDVEESSYSEDVITSSYE